jgi:hypothetical protein
MHHYPDSPYSTYAFFIIAIIIESALNGVFFAEGSEAGLVGGIGTALVIAFFNVTIGGMIGIFSLRYKNHYKQWKVLLGWGGVVIGTVISFIFNLLVAHYRTAMTLDPDNAASKAMETFSEGILSISDVQSCLLFLLGVLFYFGAVYKGYKADDAYPGYGILARKRDKQHGYLSDDKSSADDLIQEAHEEFVENLDHCFKTIQLKSKHTMLYEKYKAREIQKGDRVRHLANIRKRLRGVGYKAYRGQQWSKSVRHVVEKKKIGVAHKYLVGGSWYDRDALLLVPGTDATTDRIVADRKQQQDRKHLGFQ